MLHKNVIADYKKCKLSDHDDDKYRDTVNVHIKINVWNNLSRKRVDVDIL